MKLIIIAILLTSLADSSIQQKSTPDSPSYRAAVIEYAYERQTNINSTQILNSNWNEYYSILSNLPIVDIVVFPEMTLNGILTAVELPPSNFDKAYCDESTIPLGNLVKSISCAAKNGDRYIVVNIVTKTKCPDAEMIADEDPRNCTDSRDGFFYFNTNVVFDRRGVVISKYRKFNLFGEAVDKPFKPALVTFKTDFGVEFGHFICFDLAFRYPALELVRRGITDIIFTTMWFSELPFLTAVQFQQNWAYANNVNLLASGANNVEVGSTGSGIYAGRKGAIMSTMEGSSNTRIIVATVPKRIPANERQVIIHSASRYTKEEMKPLKLKRDQLDRYTIKFLKSPEIGVTYNYTTTSCHNEQCCDFKLRYRLGVKHGNSYEYATAVYHGNRTFDGFADGGIISCSIIACQTRNISTCGVRNETLENNFEWLEIDISGNFPNEDGQYFYLPTSLDTSILPLGPSEFDYSASVVSEKIANDNDTTLFIRMSLTDFEYGIQKDLLAFGIYGRDFNLDVADGSSFKEISMFAILIGITSFFLTI